MNMKKTGIIITALVLALGLTQCKKEGQNMPADENGNVSITLDVKGNGNSRFDVNTTTGAVTYQSGDVVYVVSAGTFIGTLTHDGNHFSGSILEPTEGEPLYFYFLGNTPPVEALTQGISETCSVIISDQTNRLPAIECAPSNETYTEGTTTFTAKLRNKCALVKFDVTSASASATCMTGFNNTVTIAFADASFTYGMTGEGEIKLPNGSGEKWAILLPQETLEAGEAGSAYSADGFYTGTRGAIPAITENSFLTTGIPVTVDNSTNSGGIIDSKFTVDAYGNQVCFSQGNLQFQGSTQTWRFALHQWDFVGDATNGNVFEGNIKCDNGLIDSNYSGWIDLFGWGTSGYNHGATCYQPWSTNSNAASSYYAYGQSSYNLYNNNGQADWGYNAIANGGNIENCGWRTLKREEWEYVFNTRTTASGIRYAKAVVNTVPGVILLPDNWVESTCTLNNTNSSDSDFTGNTITTDDWNNLFEANGAIFLPAAGYRNGKSIYNTGESNRWGMYWSSTRGKITYGATGNSISAYKWRFSSTVCEEFDDNRYKGYSVRLVRNVR